MSKASYATLFFPPEKSFSSHTLTHTVWSRNFWLHFFLQTNSLQQTHARIPSCVANTNAVIIEKYTKLLHWNFAVEDEKLYKLCGYCTTTITSLESNALSLRGSWTKQYLLFAFCLFSLPLLQLNSSVLSGSPALHPHLNHYDDIDSNESKSEAKKKHRSESFVPSIDLL